MRKKDTYLKPYYGNEEELEKLCLSITDCPHSTPNWTETGKFVVRSSNIKNGVLSLKPTSYTDMVSFDLRNRRAKPEPEDLIITREAPMGEVCIVPKNIECCLGQRMVLLKPKKEKISSLYLLYAILSEYVQKQIKGSNRTGSTVSNLNIPLLKELKIPLLDNQEEIALILSTLDKKIALNNRINTELEAMAKTLYDYWFVQFDFPISEAQANALGKPELKGKPYKSSGGKMVFNEALKREIPEGWESGIASDLFSFNRTISLKKGKLSGYIDMNALPTTGFMTKNVQQKEFNGGVKFKNGDLIIARITPCLENGKTGLITLLDDDEVGFGSTEFIVLRGKSMSLSAFASYLSRSELFRKYAIANMTGTSGRKRVDAKALEVFSLPIPDVKLLENFENTVSSFFEIETNNVKQNQQLTQLRDWLLPMLMNGQVTVK